MVLEVVTTLHLDVADHQGFNLSSICEYLYSDFLPPQSKDEKSRCWWIGETETANVTKNMMPKGLAVEVVFNSLTEILKRKKPSQDDAQSSFESESATSLHIFRFFTSSITMNGGGMTNY